MNILKSFLRRLHSLVSRKCPPLSMLAVFLFRIRLSEYRLYAKIKHERGTDCFVLGGVFSGTGDYYCVGLYLGQWLELQGIKNYAYITKQGAEEKTAMLFPVFQGHIYSVSDPLILPSCLMLALCGENEVDLRFFHLPTLPNSICGGKKNVLQGYRGLDMLDYYLYGGLCLPRDTKPRVPEFSRNTGFLQQLFAQYGAAPGRTVLLAPHTTGNAAYRLPDTFWEQLADSLREMGYHTLTNCAGSEPPIQGTASAYIPYGEIVPFLERADWFIGIRSGLCEIISSAACKKVILHTHHSEWWHDGHSIPYTGLVHMGLCDDAMELEYVGENAAATAIIREAFE